VHGINNEENCKRRELGYFASRKEAYLSPFIGWGCREASRDSD
jgi:hypothetical protein